VRDRSRPRRIKNQAAATKGLRSVAQHSSRQSNLVLTIHNPTTERDLRPLKQGEYRHSTSHRHLAAANAEMLQALQRRPGVTVTLRVDAGAPPACLMQEAEDTARSGDLRPMKYVGDATHAKVGPHGTSSECGTRETELRTNRRMAYIGTILRELQITQ